MPGWMHRHSIRPGFESQPPHWQLHTAWIMYLASTVSVSSAPGTVNPFHKGQHGLHKQTRQSRALPMVPDTRQRPKPRLLFALETPARTPEK